MKKCKVCKEPFRPRYSSVEMFCSTKCSYQYKNAKESIKIKPKRIKQVSNKRAKEIPKYKKQRLEFLKKNQQCFICNKKANTIEHTKGRQGYADDYARENNISLYLDERFWKPCCLECNLELERNPELSKQYQLSKIHKGKKI